MEVALGEERDERGPRAAEPATSTFLVPSGSPMVPCSLQLSLASPAPMPSPFHLPER